jgi:hypothetical protein
MKLTAPAALLVLLLASTSPGSDPRPAAWDATNRYEERKVEGWRVLVNKALLARDQRQLCDDTLEQLGRQLYDIGRAVPAAALARLREIPIWVELAHPKHPCMCYHPSAGWLRENLMNPDKAGGVEIANARTFRDWSRQQPWMVLHELAHGYHFRVLGADHAGVKACYERAVRSKSYESVLHHDGKKVRHYALTDDKEYFAEATEAYFGTNDYYPFVRAELKEHDPKAFELMEEVWGVKRAP